MSKVVGPAAATTAMFCSFRPWQNRVTPEKVQRERRLATRSFPWGAPSHVATYSCRGKFDHLVKIAGFWSGTTPFGRKHEMNFSCSVVRESIDNHWCCLRVGWGLCDARERRVA